MPRFELDPDSPSGKWFTLFWNWLFVGLGACGVYNLGSVLLTGSLWVHSGNRSQGQWSLISYPDSPLGFLLGLFQALFFTLLGVLGVYLIVFKHGIDQEIHDVVYLDVDYPPGQAPQETVLKSKPTSVSRFKPISFSCQATLASTPSKIVNDMFNLTLWPSFQGYGPLPGIARAEFESGPFPGWTGTRIRVENTDGSEHIEEVKAWDGSQLVMELNSFSPPLVRLASHFVETWHFAPLDAGQTLVKRQFELYPHSLMGSILLRLIAYLLKQAVQQHLDQMANYPAAA